MKKTLLILTMLCISQIGISQTVGDTFIENFITYEVTSVSPNKVRTIGYNTAGGTNVTIPAMVNNSNITFDVTNIGPSSFFNKQLNSVSIPNSVTEIRNSAFFNNNLTAITIPENVTNIQSQAFKGNPITSVGSLNLTPPSIPNEGVADAFDNRNSIDLYIPVGTTGPYITDTGAKWTGFATVTEGVLSVSEFAFQNNVKVISKTDKIIIAASNNAILEKYTLYTISGVNVATGTENEFDSSTFASGIYIIKLQFDKGIVTKKLILH